MFNNFFKQLSNLRNETRLLEACNWSEEDLELLKESLSSAVEKVFRSGVSNKDDAILKIKAEMSSHGTGEQIDILVEILEESISESLEDSIKAGYEN